MKILCYDGTEEGFYSAVFAAYEQKIVPRILSDDFQPQFGDVVERIVPDPAHAERVRRKVAQIGGRQALHDVAYVLASCAPERGSLAFGFVRQLLKHGSAARYMLAEPEVIDFFALERKVGAEVHRMKGLLRFQETESGVLYAHYEPDHNSTAFLLPHLRARYAAERFLIHDGRRNVVGIYDGRRTKVFESDAPLVVYLSEEETVFSELFKVYYKSVNIPERKNIRQMLAYMPRRYHKNLQERH